MFLIDSITHHHQQPTAEKVHSQLLSLLESGKRGSSGSFPLSDTRLEFRPFGAVKHYRRDLPLQDYLAARPPRPHLHLSDYLAARLTATPASRWFLLPEATRAATRALVFSDCFPPLRPGSQQAAAVKVSFTTQRHQQDFSFTPSEPNLLFTYESVSIRGPHEQAIDLASTREVR